MDILIVGAGLGGLAAACSFTREGHRVQVFERQPKLSPKGGLLMIRPPASQVLHSWGLEDAIGEVGDKSMPFEIRDLKKGKGKTRKLPYTPTKYPDWGVHRSKLQDVLYSRALQAGAQITFDCVVEDFTDEVGSRPSLTLRGGETVTGDLILAADGIRSRLRAKILAGVPPASIAPITEGLTLYGAIVPTERMESDDTAKVLLDQVEPAVWVDRARFIVSRKSRKHDFWSGLFGIVQPGEDQANLWDEDGDIELVRKRFEGSCPEIVATLNLATSCDRWKIAEMPDLPRWTSPNGRTVLLGDSAHAMQPNAAQGLSQIIEDIGVLNILLKSAPDLPIPTITQLWEQLRKPRAERIKGFAAWNTDMFLGKKDNQPPPPEDAAKQWMAFNELKPDPNAAFNTAAFFKWAHDFDVIGDALQSLQEFRKHTSKL